MKGNMKGRMNMKGIMNTKGNMKGKINRDEYERQIKAGSITKMTAQTKSLGRLT